MISTVWISFTWQVESLFQSHSLGFLIKWHRQTDVLKTPLIALHQQPIAKPNAWFGGSQTQERTWDLGNKIPDRHVIPAREIAVSKYTRCVLKLELLYDKSFGVSFGSAWIWIKKSVMSYCDAWLQSKSSSHSIWNHWEVCLFKL